MKPFKVKLLYEEYLEFVNNGFIKAGIAYVFSLLTLGFFALLFAWSKGMEASTQKPIFIFIAIALLLLVFAKMSLRWTFEKTGLGSAELSYKFNDKGFDVKIGGDKKTILFSQIKKVIETKSLFVLKLPYGGVNIIPKRCVPQMEFKEMLVSNSSFYKIKLIKNKQVKQ